MVKMLIKWYLIASIVGLVGLIGFYWLITLGEWVSDVVS